MYDRSISRYLAPAFLVLGPMLAAANWYLQPHRAAAWAITEVLFGAMAVAYFLAWRRPGGEARDRARDSIRSGVVFAGLILVISLSLKLATTLGILGDTDLARRAPMVVLGGFFVLTGNAMPKMLTPLSALRCDAARVQAFQRVSGWTWVLAGLGYAVAWILLPVDLAEPVSTGLIASAMLVVIGQMFRLRRT